ncbi:uncharacterized protein [Physcomitrium patens]|nr:uncharacterized protein LOC112281282 isoform X1 [Physcomitrium patens]PNR61931.1 hypothetical protein PHYPA_000355 [Physcomitrium patens]|eukprot:XP_024373387.1 uncharacterized protein LOC112281282 isoform X1 [Physcomitrella patens]
MGVPGTSHSCGDGALPPTNLAYFDDMRKLHSNAIVAGVITEGERLAVVLDQTILHPQGGGQPFDTGSIEAVDGTIKFCVTDVRTKSGVVYHYGNYHENRVMEATGFEPGHEVKISVDGARRTLNSRLHSAGHLLDACMSNIGLGSLEPGKGYHFPDGPFVEYKGTIPSSDLENKRDALESEANHLIALGGQVRATVASYSEAAALCGGRLPDYIAKESCPRIICLGENLGCPCGGTHVLAISEIGEIKVSQIRVRKGVTKVYYNLPKSEA